MSSNESVEAAEQPRRSVWAVIRSILTEVVVVVVAAVILSVLWRTFVAQMYIIPSGSMENTLQVDDRVLVAKFGGFQRGDVVVFDDPGDWLTTSPPPPDAFRETLEFIGIFPSSSSEHLIKRVIGMPGDHVSFGESGKITVNGHELDEQAYLYASDGVQIPPATVPFDVVVPEGHIFVMGDHRNHSADSRCRLTRESDSGPRGSAAFVPMDKVVGASVAILAPLPRLSTFIVPETFADVPDPTEPAPSEAVINLAEPGC